MITLLHVIFKTCTIHIFSVLERSSESRFNSGQIKRTNRRTRYAVTRGRKRRVHHVFIRYVRHTLDFVEVKWILAADGTVKARFEKSGQVIFQHSVPSWIVLAHSCYPRVNNLQRKHYAPGGKNHIQYLAAVHIFYSRFSEQKVNKIFSFKRPDELRIVLPEAVVLFGSYGSVGFYVFRNNVIRTGEVCGAAEVVLSLF
mgnify:CR=1 FL=1